MGIGAGRTQPDLYNAFNLFNYLGLGAPWRPLFGGSMTPSAPPASLAPPAAPAVPTQREWIMTATPQGATDVPAPVQRQWTIGAAPPPIPGSISLAAPAPSQPLPIVPQAASPTPAISPSLPTQPLAQGLLTAIGNMLGQQPQPVLKPLPVEAATPQPIKLPKGAPKVLQALMQQPIKKKR